MTSILKRQELKTELKRKGKRKADEMEVDGETEPQAMKKKNKQRVLLLSSRGITHRMRHLMNDLEALLPHVKKGM
jgi:ribosome biogenesis protein BRX1